MVLVERFGAMVILVLVWIVKAWHDIAISTGNTNNFKVEDTKSKPQSPRPLLEIKYIY